MRVVMKSSRIKESALGVLCLSAGLAFPFAANAASYSVDYAHSTLEFTGNYQGQDFNGKFGKWQATVNYDPAHLDTSKADVTIDLSSVSTGDSTRDSTLPDSDFFNVAKFPQAHFVTTGFHQQGDHVVADGNLTLKGHTAPVELTVKFDPRSHGAVLDVTGQLKRLDYGVGNGQYADTSVIGGNVSIAGHLVLDDK
ncbi:Protein YceI [Halomonadaceae bacterium LMG 33818]